MVETLESPGLINESESKLAGNKYSVLADDKDIRKTMEALKNNGIDSFVFNTAEEVKKKLFELLPKNTEVMDMTSVTLKTLGITDELKNSTNYNSLRKQLPSMNKDVQRKRASTADYAIGSVHAVTLKGEVLIASATGSQLSAYAYGSEKVIWVVGTQKIVKDISEGMERLREYCLPLEDQRALKAYNSHSKIAKILTINSDTPGRLIILFVKQKTGF